MRPGRNQGEEKRGSDLMRLSLFFLGYAHRFPEVYAGNFLLDRHEEILSSAVMDVRNTRAVGSMVKL